jgi:predicted ester cyclase
MDTHGLQIVERFDALLNRDDIAELDELCTPDMVNHSLADTRPPGLAGTREFLATDGRRLSTERWQELQVIADNDLVVQVGVRAGEWPGGSLRGVTMHAGRYTRPAAFMYRITNERISERWAVNDHLTMLLQLGGRVV